MITPEFLETITDETTKTVRFMQTKILKRMCKRIESSLKANEENILIPSTINEIHQLMDSGMMIDDIEKEVEKALPRIRIEIQNAFLQSAQEISNYNTDIAKDIVKAMTDKGMVVDVEIPRYERVGLPKNTGKLNMTSHEVRKLEQIYHGANRMVENMCRLLPVQGNETYLRLATEGFLKVQGGITVGEAITEAIKDASKMGVSVVNYTSGHVDSIEVATARAVRTAIGKANAEIVLTRASEMGVGYVKVSEHYGARVTQKNDYTNHSIWQGKVYKLDWDKPELSELQADAGDEKGFAWLKNLKSYVKGFFKKNAPSYPDFVETCGYGKMLGISGINCRHTFYPFFPETQEEPDIAVDYIDNKQFYADTQKQREMERRIRKTKTEIYNLKDVNLIEAKERIDYLNRILDRQTQALFEFCEQKGLKVDNWRLMIHEGDNTRVIRR